MQTEEKLIIIDKCNRKETKKALVHQNASILSLHSDNDSVDNIERTFAQINDDHPMLMP